MKRTGKSVAYLALAVLTAAAFAGGAGAVDSHRCKQLLSNGDEQSQISGGNPEALDCLLWSAVSDADAAKTALLLSKGANPNSYDETGVSLLARAVSKGNAAVVGALVNDSRVDVNAALNREPAPTGSTALHYAAGGCDLKISQALLDKGANINAVYKVWDRNGKMQKWTPLSIAERNGCDAGYLDFLKSKGAK
ncbi:MAG: ankyrin repeat domain-containing protein [Elusimicrobiales bacterium]|nr:ankyrin repeat domain-containing protein [Elusimicrobiales bacterium]